MIQIKAIKPEPVQRDDGGADYKTNSCPKPCYSVNKEGCGLCQCDFLEIGNMRGVTQLYCSEGSYCDD